MGPHNARLERSRQVSARDEAKGRGYLSPGQVARLDALRGGQLRLLRPRPHRDGHQLVARVPTWLAMGGTRATVERQHVCRFHLELRVAVASVTPADAQLGVRKRGGLRGE